MDNFPNFTFILVQIKGLFILREKLALAIQETNQLTIN